LLLTWKNASFQQTSYAATENMLSFCEKRLSKVENEAGQVGGRSLLRPDAERKGHAQEPKRYFFYITWRAG